MTNNSKLFNEWLKKSANRPDPEARQLKARFMENWKKKDGDESGGDYERGRRDGAALATATAEAAIYRIMHKQGGNNE